MTNEFDSTMPDPFNLKKKTVKMPDMRDYADKDPLFFAHAQQIAGVKEDQNVLIAAMQWNNRATGQVLTGFQKRLEDGDKMLTHMRTIAWVTKWVIAPALVIFLGEGAIHILLPK